jgi:hypothetical protein
MFERYSWTIAGTVVPTDKKTRDIPFFKMSYGAKNEVKHGWFCEAVLECFAQGNKQYYIQATTWHDIKQVTFLSSNKVDASYGHMVHWRERGNNASRLIDAPQAQQDCIKYFNAVDPNDRDSADYSTSIRTNRYYLWIFC